MRPRQFTLALIFGIIAAVLGYFGAAALNLSPNGGAVVIGILGVAFGIGLGRYLGKRARLAAAGKALPVVEEHHHPVSHA